MTNILTEIFETDFGRIILGSYKDKLCLCDWYDRKKRDAVDNRLKKHLKADYETAKDVPVLQQTKQELNAFFEGKRKEFTIPLLLAGSDFQKSVWNGLLATQYGETLSYLELSRRLGDEKAIRAVANANGANAISIIVPCHRIIGSDGSLTGYAGGIEIKKRLLEVEGHIFAKEIEQPSLF
ncbi:methylated-DNA--[protein]-cysteine S-methyltransferase [Curvivirga sp.]|uniref:methylated-DNA--[protein]-cysteine S-methyltransferase n=1 Tax=Curvivirga sp. TaxID=2856848 RepID=UPI003B59C64A